MPDLPNILVMCYTPRQHNQQLTIQTLLLLWVIHLQIYSPVGTIVIALTMVFHHVEMEIRDSTSLYNLLDKVRCVLRHLHKLHTYRQYLL